MKDMTVGSTFKHVLYFTIPLLIGNLAQQLYTLADTMIVGRTLGTGALGAIGAVGSVIFFIQGFVTGVSSGLSIVLAQRFGSKNEDRIHASYVTSIWLSFAVVSLFSLASILFADSLIRAMNIPMELYAESKAYFLATMFGLIIMMGFNLLSNVMRAMGSTTSLLFYTIVSHVLNFGLDIILIKLFSFGVVGVAIATVLSQLTVSILMFRYLSSRYPVLKLTKNDWRLRTEELRTHITISFPIGFQNSIISIGNIILQIKLNELTIGNIEGHAIAIRLEGMITAPLLTIGLAAATFVAQNYGAGKFDRIWQGIRISLIISLVYSSVVGGFMYFKGSEAAKWLVGASNESTLVSIESYFKMTALFYGFLAVLFVLRFSLQGMGRTIAPTVSGILEMGIRSIVPVAFVGVVGYPAVVYSHPLAWGSTAAIMTAAIILIAKDQKKRWWERALVR